MKKIFNIILLVFSIFIFNSLKVNAFSSLDYENRTLCGYYEVAAFNEDGTIEQISCHNYFEEAKAKMLENGNDNVKEDYINSINSIIENGWFDIEKFISYYLIASNHYSNKIVLSDKFTNEYVEFSLKENNDIYSNENLSVDIYIATKLKNYSEYKSKDSE